MFTGVKGKDDSLVLIEWKLCIKCCRMMKLNLEEYGMVKTKQGWLLYGHTECPKDKFFNDEEKSP